MVALEAALDCLFHYALLTKWFDWDADLEKISNKMLISGSYCHII